MLGNGRVEAMCFDGEKRLAHIRGKMRKKVSQYLFNRFSQEVQIAHTIISPNFFRFGSIKEISSFCLFVISKMTRPTLFKSTPPMKLVTSRLTVNYPKLPKLTKPILSDLEMRMTTSSSTKSLLTRKKTRAYLR